MQLIDLRTQKGTYLPGEDISLNAVIYSDVASERELQLTLHHIAERIELNSVALRLAAGRHVYPLAIGIPSADSRSYWIEARLEGVDSSEASRATTAFDVLASWTDNPRYGFLCDFSPGREPEPALDWLASCHINGLQFYDWQYRHDQLVAATDTYADPLGRENSLSAVRNLIEAAHKRGMACTAYMAVYAASLPFAEAHQDWRLFNEEGMPVDFEGFLGLMDPSPDGEWSEHLLEQASRTLELIPFDGLHVDQYGEPRSGANARGEPVDLPGSFLSFVEALKSRHPESAVTFNAVKNWPIETLATAPQDFLYIEVWPDAPRYDALREIVAEGRRRSGGKPVVIAQYIRAAHVPNLRLSSALILSLGGTRIELGEDARLLTDPYFPKHQAIPEDLNLILRRICDFAWPMVS